MLELREYQKPAVRIAVRFMRSDDATPSLIVLPTGWGKSVLAAYCAAYIGKDEKLLVVQPSRELLEQNRRKYELLCGSTEGSGVFSASFGRKEMERITFATIGSIKDLGKEFREMGFRKMLIDEAHLYPRNESSMLGGFLRDSGIRQVLGITATPLKLEQFNEKQGEHFDKWSELLMLTAPSPSGTFFKRILKVGQISELTRGGYWSPLIYEEIPFDTSMLRMNSTGSEWSADSEAAAYAFNNVRANIYAALDWHRERKRCIVYVPTVEEAAILAAGYPSSAYISGETPKKERDETLNRFREGTLRVLFNVGVLSTGVDIPAIDMLVLAFSTASVAKYTQIVGRGVRLYPKKENCLVVDMGANVKRFGRAEDVQWELTDRWRMYGTGGRLLSGIPVDCVGQVTKEEIERCRRPELNADALLSAGRYAGLPAGSTPMSYKRWYIKQGESNTSRYMRDLLLRSMEDYVRDTTNEPPEVKLPDGRYAGQPMAGVPTGYLAWYYNSKEWNECNDSLRRGIENIFGGKAPTRKR